MLATLMAPAVQLMRRLPLSQKFNLVALGFLVPIGFLLYTVVTDRLAVLRFTQMEVEGEHTITAFEPAFAPALAWSRSVLGVMASTEGAEQRRERAAQELSAALASAETYLSRKKDPFKLLEPLQAVTRHWEQVRQRKLASPEEATEVGTELVAQVQRFIELVAQKSNLALDPDADSYHLMLAHTADLPKLLAAIGRVRAVGTYLAASQMADAPELFMALHNADALTDEYLTRARYALGAAAAANADIAKSLDLDTLTRLEKELVERIDSTFAWGESPKTQAAQWQALTSRHIEALDALQVAVGEHLEQLLQARAKRLQFELWGAALVALFFVVLSAYLLTGFFIASQSTFKALERRIERLGTGDLTPVAPLLGGDELARAGNMLTDAMGQLARLVNEVRASADSIGTGAAQISSGNQDLSHRGSELAAVVEETSASTATLEDAVNVNLASAREANDLVQSAASVASKGGAVVEQAVQAMSAITGSSRKIGDIIQVIDTIAFQTNILALNAAVEAARAGDQGRGFAVVASEVRALAQRSASAAREIKGLIQDSIDTVQRGEQYVTEAGNTMTEMVRSIERVTTLVGDITSQSQSQAHHIGELAIAIRQVDNTVQQNAALIEETAAASASLDDRAHAPNSAMAKFTVES